MKNKIQMADKKLVKYLVLILLIFSISSISAVEIYSGESYNLTLDKQYEYFSIVGNSTTVDIEVTQNSDNVVTIIPNKYSPDDSFEIIFFDIEKKIIVEYQSSGGGGSSTKTIYQDKNVIQYVDREVDVPGETITQNVEVEKIVGKTQWWVWGIVIILIGVVSYILLFYPHYFSKGGDF